MPLTLKASSQFSLDKPCDVTPDPQDPFSPAGPSPPAGTLDVLTVAAASRHSADKSEEAAKLLGLLGYPPRALNAHAQISQSALRKGTLSQPVCKARRTPRPPILGLPAQDWGPLAHFISTPQSKLEVEARELLPPHFHASVLLPAVCVRVSAWGTSAFPTLGSPHAAPLAARPSRSLKAEASGKLRLQVPVSGREKGRRRLPGEEKAKSVPAARSPPRAAATSRTGCLASPARGAVRPHSPALSKPPPPSPAQPPGAAEPRASQAQERWWCVSGDHPFQRLAPRRRLWLLSTEGRGGGRHGAVERHLLYTSALPLAAWCVPGSLGARAAGSHLAPRRPRQLLPTSPSFFLLPFPRRAHPPEPQLSPHPQTRVTGALASSSPPPLPETVFRNFESSGSPAGLSPGYPSLGSPRTGRALCTLGI